MENPYNNLSDEELMVLYQKGENLAFQVIYSRYEGKVYSYLYKRISNRLDVEDVFQSVFIKLHRGVDRYDSKYIFPKWIFSICRNEVIDFHRKLISNRATNHKYIEIERSSPKDQPDAPDIHQYVQDASLSGRESEVLQMRYEKDLEFSEISEALSTSDINIRKIISRGIRKLKTKYGGSNHEE